MKIEKHRVHLLAIAAIAILAISFLLLNSLKILAETMTSSTACTMNCSDWSACNSSGIQTRTCNPYPSSCPGDTRTEEKTCTYVPTNCSTNCSDWSDCSSGGTQTRTCKPYPEECPGDIRQESETCTYTSSSTSTPFPCEYTYTEWGSCNSSGIQYRSIKSYSPAGCVGGSVKELKRSCTYTSSQQSATSGTTAQTSTEASGNETSTGGSESIEVDYGGGAGTAAAPSASNQPSALNNTSSTSQGSVPIDTSWSVTADWQEKYFGSSACPKANCEGDADPDKDRLANNDEARYGTNPLDPDTDGDGKLDGDEVARGTDPLKSSAKGEEDAMVYENPKEESAGVVKSNIYQVTNVEMVEVGEGKKGLKVFGKGPALSYVTVYIYSGDPVIVTVKTDSNGDWTYTVDKELDDGNHEVYVAVTNNSGAIKAKSEPLPFVKTAQAVTVTSAAEANAVQPTTKSGISIRNILFILALAFFAVVLAFILIGVVIKKLASKIKMN